MNRLFFTLLALVAFQGLLLAQTNVPNAPITASEFTEKGITVESWSFLADEEEQNFYIDFETISVNLNEVIVKDEEGNIVSKESVSNLPVDAIYELDCSQFPKGQYIVELHAYTEVLRKSFSVK